MKYIFLGMALLLASCNADAQAKRNTEEYQTQMARLLTGMTVDEVQGVLGAPYYEETDKGDKQYTCALYHDTATDGRPLMHEARFTSGKLTGHIVGLDYGVMACDPNKAL